MPDWLVVERLGFRYGSSVVLSDLSLAVADPCRILAIVGPSGVGKSTLVALIAGHLAAQQGRIEVGGESVRRPDAARPVVFQDHNLFPWMTVLENVTFGPRCLRVPAGERQSRGMALLRRMGLAAVAHAYPSTLSGGMRQRVGLARALAVDPRCILLDEPFQSLDAPTRETLRSEFAALVRQRGIHAVIVTHDLDEAALVADAALVLLSAAQHELVTWNPTADGRAGAQRDRVRALSSLWRRSEARATARAQDAER